jgi:hypothetical protein
VLLWAAGIWVLLDRAAIWWRLVIGTVMACILFYCHLVAFGLFGLFVAGYEVGKAASTFRAQRWGILPSLFAGAAIFIVPLVLFFASRTGSAGGVIDYGSYFLLKKVAKFRMLFFADWTLDISLVVAIVGVAFIVWRYGRFRIARGMIGPLIAIALAYLVLPHRAMTGAYLDTRLVVPFALLLIAASSAGIGNARLRRAVTAALFVFLAARSVFLTTQWIGYDRQIQQFADAFDALPEDAIVIATSAAPKPLTSDIDLELWQPPLKHIVSLASIGRSVFVPATYAEAAQQPLTVTPKYAGLYAFQPDRDPIPIDDTEELLATRDRLRDLLAADGIAGEPVYVLVNYPERLDVTPDDFPTLVASGPHFYLLALEGWN